MTYFNWGALVTSNYAIDPFRVSGLLSHLGPCDDTLENSRFQISNYSRGPRKRPPRKYEKVVVTRAGCLRQ